MATGPESYREREAREKSNNWNKYLAMTADQRSGVLAGMQSLQYLLGRVPRTYRGPMATAEDCASIANVDAYLERNGIAKP